MSTTQYDTEFQEMRRKMQNEQIHPNNGREIVPAYIVDKKVKTPDGKTITGQFALIRGKFVNTNEQQTIYDDLTK